MDLNFFAVTNLALRSNEPPPASQFARAPASVIICFSKFQKHEILSSAGGRAATTTTAKKATPSLCHTVGCPPRCAASLASPPLGKCFPSCHCVTPLAPRRRSTYILCADISNDTVPALRPSIGRAIYLGQVASFIEERGMVEVGHASGLSVAFAMRRSGVRSSSSPPKTPA